MASVLKHLGQGKIKARRCFRPRLHGHAKTRATGMAAVDRQDKDVLAPLGIDGVAVGPAQEDTVLDGNPCRSQERTPMKAILGDSSCAASAVIWKPSSWRCAFQRRTDGGNR